MDTTKRYPNVANWLLMTQDEVLDKFANIPTAFSDGEGDKRFVFIEGTRKDKALLVAHSDTVWGNEKVTLGHTDGILYSKKRDHRYTYTNRYNTTISRTGVGIGADDRAGCAILWYLRDLGHSLLITSGEEQGCITSHWLMKHEWWQKTLNNHSFAIEFDRKNKNDIVFYNIGTNKFVEYVKQMTGYVPEEGSNTDIKVICKDICGVNISCGYFSEHNTDERLVIDYWMNTLGIARSWLSEKNIPKFELDRKDLFVLPQRSYYSNGYNTPYPDDYTSTNPPQCVRQHVLPPGNNIKFRNNPSIQMVVCTECKCPMPFDLWCERVFKCINCDKPF